MTTHPMPTTEQATWTPGPWKWDEPGFSIAYPTLRSTDGATVLEPDLEWSPEPGEGLDEAGIKVSHANARLIAAAPDLIKAAKRLRAAQRAYMAVRDLPSGDPAREGKGKEVAEAAAELDAAIALAEGRE